MFESFLNMTYFRFANIAFISYQLKNQKNKNKGFLLMCLFDTIINTIIRSILFPFYCDARFRLKRDCNQKILL